MERGGKREREREREEKNKRTGLETCARTRRKKKTASFRMCRRNDELSFSLISGVKAI